MKTSRIVLAFFALILIFVAALKLWAQETFSSKNARTRIVYAPPVLRTSESGEQEVEVQLMIPPPTNGVFWPLSGEFPPTPFAPNPQLKLPVYFWDEGIFLWDDECSKAQMARASGVPLFDLGGSSTRVRLNQPRTAADGPPSPGGGGGSTNEWPTNSLPAAYSNTNGLWIEIADATNSVLLTLHNTEEAQVYYLMVKTNLNQSTWTQEQSLTGLAGTNSLSTSVSKSGRDSLFFLLQAPAMLRVATPSFDPASGDFVANRKVVFFDATEAATIHYTTNGAAPTTNDAVIASGASLTITNTAQVKAKVWKAGLLPSEMATADYTIHIATPTFSLASGVYALGQAVGISCASADAMIYFTTNGMDPTTNSAVIVSGGSVVLNDAITLKAKASRGTEQSGISSAVFQIRSAPANDNIANAQIIAGISGTVYGTSIGATLEVGENFCSSYPEYEPSSSVWYLWTAPSNGIATFDTSGSDFETELDIYSGSNWTNCGAGLTSITNGYADAVAPEGAVARFDVQVGAHYKIAVAKPFWVGAQGNIRLTWTMETQAATPTFSPEGGTFNTNQTVTVGCATADAIIHYTLDGNDPTENDPAVFPGDNIDLNASYTLKAKAWRTGLAASAVASSSYVINTNATNLTLVVANPAFSPSSTNFSSSLSVTVSCATAGAAIHFTTNGFEPTTNDAVIASGSSLILTNTRLLKAKAWKTGSNASGIQSGVYAENNGDTDFDSVSDGWELAHGSDVFLADGGEVSNEPFAHGLNNLQVFQNQSVLLAAITARPATAFPIGGK